MNNIRRYLPDSGDHLMTIQEWEDGCDCGLFTDYDGFGYFTNPLGDDPTELFGFDVMPSDHNERREAYEQRKANWTHINWFNR